MICYPGLEVAFSVVAEAGSQLAGFGVQGEEPAIHCAYDNLRRQSLIAAPVGNPASGRGGIGFVLPDFLPRLRLERDDADGWRGQVQHAVHDQRPGLRGPVTDRRPASLRPLASGFATPPTPRALRR